MKKNELVQPIEKEFFERKGVKKEVELLENPLPLPKKKESAQKIDFDIDIDANDDFDF